METQTLQKSSVIILLILVALGFQNCAQTSFSELPNEPVASLQTPSANGEASTGACVEGESFERVSGEVQIPKAHCVSGFDTFENLSTYRCENGNLTVLRSRPGRLLVSGFGANCSGTNIPGVTNPGSSGSGTTVPPLQNCGTMAHGSTVWKVEGQQRVLANNCADGSQTYDIYAAEKQYQCQSGAIVATGQTRRGGLLQTAPACQMTRPVYCTDYYAKAFCDAYQYLFGRWPDQPGVEFWTVDLANRGIPVQCWKREISFGTRNSDCELHMSIHKVYPNSNLCPASPRGDAPEAAPQAGCPR